GVRVVRVLSSFSAETESVAAKVFRLDLNLNGVVDCRSNKNAGKGSVPPALLVKGRDTHQAVHADLAGEQTVGVVAVDGESSGLDAGFFRRLVLEDLRGETLTLGPPQVHAQEHLRPVLRLRSTGAGMDSHDGVTGIVLAGEESLGFQFLGELAQPIDLFFKIVDHSFTFACQVKVGGDVTCAPDQVLVLGKLAFQAAPLAVELLRARLVRPHAGIGKLPLDFV